MVKVRSQKERGTVASDFFFLFLFLAVFYLWCLRVFLQSIRMQQAMASGDSRTRLTAEEESVRGREEEEVMK